LTVDVFVAGDVRRRPTVTTGSIWHDYEGMKYVDTINVNRPRLKRYVLA